MSLKIATTVFLGLMLLGIGMIANASAQWAPQGLCAPAGQMDAELKKGPDGPIMAYSIRVPVSTSSPTPGRSDIVRIYVNQKKVALLTMVRQGMMCIIARGEYSHDDQDASLN